MKRFSSVNIGIDDIGPVRPADTLHFTHQLVYTQQKSISPFGVDVLK